MFFVPDDSRMLAEVVMLRKCAVSSGTWDKDLADSFAVEVAKLGYGQWWNPHCCCKVAHGVTLRSQQVVLCDFWVGDLFRRRWALTLVRSLLLENGVFKRGRRHVTPPPITIPPPPPPPPPKNHTEGEPKPKKLII
jgi:hypothetical protein